MERPSFFGIVSLDFSSKVLDILVKKSFYFLVKRLGPKEEQFKEGTFLGLPTATFVVSITLRS